MMQSTAAINNTSRQSPITRTHRWRSLLAAAALSPVAAIITTSALVGASAPSVTELPLSDARVIIEFNSTDEDIGIQMFIDGEPWKLLRAFDPSGRKILEIKGTNSLNKQGLTELFFESSEPELAEVPLDVFLARFPEGVYEFEGITIDGELIEGAATFTHAIPEGPVLLSPQEDSVQNPNHTIVSWLPVPDPVGSTIQSYQVIVTQLLAVLPKRTFSVFVPATVTSVTVPPEFMQADAEYEFEVLAIEAGGNQTLTASFFSTN